MLVVTGENTMVTIKNGTINANGTVGQVQDGGTLKIESGSYNSRGDVAFWAGGRNITGHIIVGTEQGGPTIEAQEFAIGVGKDSTLLVQNGNLSARDNAVIGGNGSATGFDGTTITINGGTFTGNITTAGYTGCGVYHPQDGVLNINGGEFNIDGVGVCARAGQINIDGGNFTLSGKDGWVGDNKNQIIGAGVHYDGAANYPQLKEGASLHVYGAVFDGPEADVVISQGTNVTITKDIADGYTIVE